MLTPNQDSVGQPDKSKISPQDFLSAYETAMKDLIAARNPSAFDRMKGETGDSLAQDKSTNYV